MNDITFLDELEKKFCDLEKELCADNKPHIDDPSIKNLVNKIDKTIDEFHATE